MRKEAFKLWLETYGKHGVEPMSKRPIDDALSRCNRIEKGLAVDLDIDYEREMARIQLEMQEVMKQEKKSQQMLEEAFRGIGYGID